MDGYTICEVPEMVEDDNDDDDDGDGLLRRRSLGSRKKKKKVTHYYCKEDENGEYIPDMTLVAGKSKPKNDGKHPKGRKPRKQEDRECGDFCETGSNDRLLEEETSRALLTTTGSMKNLVVPIRFADHTNRNLPSVGDLTTLMNGGKIDNTIIPTGSVRDVFLENSDGRLDIVSTVANWVTISKTEAECASDKSGLTSNFRICLVEALEKVVKNVDLRNFDADKDGNIDAIAFLHSGYAAEFGGTDSYGAVNADRIWSHKWQLSSRFTSNGVSVYKYHISPAKWALSGDRIGRIGVIAHETGHFLGLPDLYDTNGGGLGLGSWSLMSNSWGFDNSQQYPPGLDPWCKMALGWITPKELSSNQVVTIKPAYSHNDYYIVRKGFASSSEYLLIENRQRLGFDGIIQAVSTHYFSRFLLCC